MEKNTQTGVLFFARELSEYSDYLDNLDVTGLVTTNLRRQELSDNSKDSDNYRLDV